MPSDPAITVLMPVYNREPFVGAAMESILAQTFRDFEFLIINDGSSDQSRQVILSYQDPRIRFLENPANLGLIASLNRGLGQARGAYVAIMDADDLSLPQRLRQQYELLENNPHLVACGASAELFGQRAMAQKWLAVGDPERIKVDLLFQSPLPHGTLLFRRALQRQFSIHYDPACLHAEDYDFIYQLSRVGQLGAIGQVLYRYRRHGDQTTLVHRASQSKASDNIRARILDDLGLKYTAEELTMHNKLATHRFGELSGQADEAEQWLGKLYGHLTARGDFNSAKVSAALWNYWLLLCLSLPARRGVSCLARILRQPLASVFPLGGVSVPKMFLYYIYRKINLGLNPPNDRSSST